MGRWGRPLSTARGRLAVAGGARAGPVKCQRCEPVPPSVGLVGGGALVQAQAR